MKWMGNLTQGRWHLDLDAEDNEGKTALEHSLKFAAAYKLMHQHIMTTHH